MPELFWMVLLVAAVAAVAWVHGALCGVVWAARRDSSTRTVGGSVSPDCRPAEAGARADPND